MVLIATRRELFDVFSSKRTTSYDAKRRHVEEFVLAKVKPSTDEEMRLLKDIVRLLCVKFRQKLHVCHRNRSKFFNDNKVWLNVAIHVPWSAKKLAGPGRPRKVFSHSAPRSKRRKARELLDIASSQALAFAAAVGFRDEGDSDAAKLIHNAAQNSPLSATHRKKNIVDSPQILNYTPDEALALKLNTGMSREKYQKLRNGMVAKKMPDMYPSHKVVLEAEKRCMPSDDKIRVTEVGAEVELQALLDHTASRCLQLIQKSTTLSDCGDIVNVTMYSKWGFDGSSGHSQYKQKQTANSGGSLLLTSLVPLQIFMGDSSHREVLWENIAPSSTRFCRPVSFQFLKETTEASKSHYKEMKSAIAALAASEVRLLGKTFIVQHVLMPVMLDGKVCSALTSTSCSNCYICEATPKQMNNLEQLSKRKVNRTRFQFGLSPLHARIRCMECCLHIAYRLDIKSWRRSTPADHTSVNLKKAAIQSRFKEETGLIIDVVKQGHGTTNDGNTARRFFADPQKTADITGIDPIFIQNLSDILNVLSCGKPVNISAFRKICRATASIYVEKYKWYYMPQAMHKLLIHGADIMSHCPLPTGFMTEEAQESRNKDLREFRMKFTRKTSSVDGNRDLLKKLLVTSDPIISSIRQPCSRNVEPTPGMLALLEPSV